MARMMRMVHSMARFPSVRWFRDFADGAWIGTEVASRSACGRTRTVPARVVAETHQKGEKSGAGLTGSEPQVLVGQAPLRAGVVSQGRLQVVRRGDDGDADPNPLRVTEARGGDGCVDPVG